MYTAVTNRNHLEVVADVRKATSCCYPPIGQETENRIITIRVVEQAYKKRPPCATATCPPALLVMEDKYLINLEIYKMDTRKYANDIFYSNT